MQPIFAVVLEKNKMSVLTIYCLFLFKSIRIGPWKPLLEITWPKKIDFLKVYA